MIKTIKLKPFNKKVRLCTKEEKHNFATLKHKQSDFRHKMKLLKFRKSWHSKIDELFTE